MKTKSWGALDQDFSEISHFGRWNESRNEVGLTVIQILSVARSKIKVFLTFLVPGVRGANVVVRLSKYDFWILWKLLDRFSKKKSKKYFLKIFFRWKNFSVRKIFRKKKLKKIDDNFLVRFFSPYFFSKKSCFFLIFFFKKISEENFLVLFFFLTKVFLYRSKNFPGIQKTYLECRTISLKTRKMIQKNVLFCTDSVEVARLAGYATPADPSLRPPGKSQDPRIEFHPELQPWLKWTTDLTDHNSTGPLPLKAIREYRAMDQKGKIGGGGVSRSGGGGCVGSGWNEKSDGDCGVWTT